MDTGALERYDGSAWVPAAPETPGIGSNVVTVTKTDTFTSASATYVDVTDLSVTITPTSATSKILVIANVTGNGATGATIMFLRLVRETNAILVGDADGSRTQAGVAGLYPTGSQNASNFTVIGLDSPNTTSARTYKVQVRNQGSGNVFVNRSDNDGNNEVFPRTASSLTVIEVAS